MNLPDIRYVQIQTQSRCNANCMFCPYVESWHAANPGAISDDLFAKILNDLQPFQGINKGKICLYLMQEPLLDKTIFDKVEQTYAAFPGTLIELSTNGDALTDKTIDRLIETFDGRKHVLWVSHHGIDAATLEYLMATNFERAHRNLIRLLQKSDGRLRIRIRGAGESRDSDLSYFSRQDYLAYWRRNFRDHDINPQGIDIDAFSFHDRAGTIFRDERDTAKLTARHVRDIGPGHEPFGCVRVDQWLHVMYDGRIRLCCMDYHGEVELPSLAEISLLDYFQSDAYRTLAEMVAGTRASPDNFICKRCTSPGG